jgi:hypothetical protein
MTCQKSLRGHDTWQNNPCGHATWRFTATVCTQGGKIGNLEKVGGYLQENILQGVSQNTPTLQGGIGLFTLEKLMYLLGVCGVLKTHHLTHSFYTLQ